MAVKFNGTTQLYARTANLPAANAITICAWVRTTTAPTVGWKIPIAAGNTGGTLEMSVGQHAPAGVVAWSLFDGTAKTDFANQPKALEACFLAFTNDGTTLRGYSRLARLPTLDAVSTTAPTGTVNAISAGTSVFDGTDFFDGLIWEYRVWNRVLTAAELLEESRSHVPLQRHLLNLTWRMRTAQDTLDRSGQGRLPTITGAPTTVFDQAEFLYRKPVSRKLFAPAGGTTFSDTRAESIAFADAQTAQADFASARAESIAFTDAQVANFSVNVQRAESVAFSDGQTAGASFANVQRDESIAFSDSQTGVFAISAQRDESIAFADAATAQADFAAARAESIAFADAQTVQAIVNVAQAESIAFTDSQAGLATFQGQRDESIAFADSQTGTVVSASTSQTDESIAFADAQTSQADFAATRAESIAFTDAQSGVGIFPVARAESVAFADSQDASVSTPGSGINVDFTATDEDDTLVSTFLVGSWRYKKPTKRGVGFTRYPRQVDFQETDEDDALDASVQLALEVIAAGMSALDEDDPLDSIATPWIYPTLVHKLPLVKRAHVT